ncbi:MAG: hypothetical protein ACYC91_16940 [Solirubrobacteraceae bacterium]
MAAALAVAAAGLSAAPGSAQAVGNLTVTTCGAGIFAPHTVSGISTIFYCPPGTNAPPGMSVLPGPGTVSAGQRAGWQANAPTGLSITGASIAANEMYSIHINDGQSWGGGFYWAGGGAGSSDGMNHYNVAGLNSPYFGFQIVCGWSTCSGSTHPAQLTVESINLSATETQGPWLSAPDGLWQAPGWVRGSWTLHFYGDSPSGICGLSAALNGQPIPGTSSAVNPAAWHQCAAPAVAQTIQTGNYGEGGASLTIRGTDAAGVSTPDVSYTKAVYIDNSQPTISFSGPADAPSTAGIQYVTATAGQSPSGIAGLSCSVDGGSGTWYPMSTVQVPVSGIGEHTVRCAAENNAVDGSGNHGWSDWTSWNLSIRQPTVSGIGFSKLVDRLLCRRVRVRVNVASHWTTIWRNHRRVGVKRRAHTKFVKETRCHPRIVRRRIVVWATVSRNGKSVRVKRHKTIRVVELPHVTTHSSKRIGHGGRTSVSGWLGLPDGTALGGQTVRVLTAPNNGLGRFTQAGVTTTQANGSWSAQLPPGPSRLVEAVYDGAPTLEPNASGQARVLVPAQVKLITISPRRVAWGGKVRITGQLVGGYLPTGGALVRLRIGFGSAYTTYGVQEHVIGNGRFSTTYTFGLGDPRLYRSYWFQIASLPMGNYPYEPAASSRATVVVGGHPHAPPPPRHSHQPKRRR